MPVPSVEEWEWLNWKFPRAVHAGDTIYARWTLTQKRPPVGGAPNSIVVWRVDLHTADGALCAEGEVGAKVRRHVVAREHRPQEPAPTATAARRRRGRRRPSTANGPVPETPVLAAPPASPASAAKPERAAGTTRRRRRRRPSGGSSAPQGEPAGSPAPPPEPAAAVPASPGPSPAAKPGGLSGVIRRLRRT